MILDEVVSYIVASSTYFKVAGSTGAKVPIWKGTLPADQAATAVAFYESGGPGPVYKFGAVDHERPGLQMISRSTAYATARLNAQRIWNVLAPVSNTTMSTVYYIQVTPTQSPFDMGKDVQGRDLVAANFIAERDLP